MNKKRNKKFAMDSANISTEIFLKAKKERIKEEYSSLDQQMLIKAIDVNIPLIEVYGGMGLKK